MCIGISSFSGMPVPPSLNIDPMQRMLNKRADKKAGPDAPKRRGLTSPDQLTLISSEAVGGLLS
jgi:hypothetical protein